MLNFAEHPVPKRALHLGASRGRKRYWPATALPLKQGKDKPFSNNAIYLESPQRFSAAACKPLFLKAVEWWELSFVKPVSQAAKY